MCDGIRVRFHRIGHPFDGKLFMIKGSNSNGLFRMEYFPTGVKDVEAFEGSVLTVKAKPEEVEPC